MDGLPGNYPYLDAAAAEPERARQRYRRYTPWEKGLIKIMIELQVPTTVKGVRQFFLENEDLRPRDRDNIAILLKMQAMMNARLNE